MAELGREESLALQASVPVGRTGFTYYEADHLDQQTRTG